MKLEQSSKSLEQIKSENQEAIFKAINPGGSEYFIIPPALDRVLNTLEVIEQGRYAIWSEELIEISGIKNKYICDWDLKYDLNGQSRETQEAIHSILTK